MQMNVEIKKITVEELNQHAQECHLVDWLRNR